MKVYALMTIHNRADLTLACLACLDDQTFPHVIAVVVDDGSTDGSADRIREKYPETVIISGDGNLWWTGGMNKGLEHVLRIASDDDVVLTLNDDTFFEKEYIQTLVNAHIACPTACIGSLLRNFFDRSRIEDSGTRMQWNGYVYHQIPFDGTQSQVRVDTLSCRGTLIPVSVFRQNGLFDAKRFPHYSADYEFFFRAHRHGTPLFMSYAAVIYNKERLNEKKPTRSLRWRMFHRKSPSNVVNHLSVIIRHSPGLYLKGKNIVVYLFRSAYKTHL